MHLLIFFSDVQSVKKPVMLHMIQEKYKIYLSYQLYVHDKQPEVFDILIAMLPELQDLGNKHLQHVKRISQDMFPYASEPVFLSEVFDCVKEEDIKKLLEDMHTDEKTGDI